MFKTSQFRSQLLVDWYIMLRPKIWNERHLLPNSWRERSNAERRQELFFRNFLSGLSWAPSIIPNSYPSFIFSFLSRRSEKLFPFIWERAFRVGTSSRGRKRTWPEGLSIRLKRLFNQNYDLVPRRYHIEPRATHSSSIVFITGRARMENIEKSIEKSYTEL